VKKNFRCLLFCVQCLEVKRLCRVREFTEAEPSYGDEPLRLRLLHIEA